MEKRIDIVQRFLKSRAVRFIAMLFILLSITSVVFSSFKDFQQYGWLFQSFIHLASLVFLIEYMLRIYSAPALHPDLPAYRSRLKYIFSFYGLVDLVAVIPFVMTYFYWDTEIVHIIILPYVFVVFKLIRYSTAFPDTLFHGLPAHTQSDEIRALRVADCFYRLSDHNLFLRDTGLLRGERSAAGSIQEYR